MEVPFGKEFSRWIDQLDAFSLSHPSCCTTTFQVNPSPDTLDKAQFQRTSSMKACMNPSYDLLIPSHTSECEVHLQGVQCTHCPMGFRRRVADRQGAAIFYTELRQGWCGKYRYDYMAFVGGSPQPYVFIKSIGLCKRSFDVVTSQGKLIGRFVKNRAECSCCYKFPIEVQISAEASRLDKLILLDIGLFLEWISASNPMIWWMVVAIILFVTIIQVLARIPQMLPHKKED